MDDFYEEDETPEELRAAGEGGVLGLTTGPTGATIFRTLDDFFADLDSDVSDAKVSPVPQRSHDEGFGRVHKQLGRLRRIVRELVETSPTSEHQERLMADIDQATQDLAKAVSDTATRVQTDIAALKAQVPANLTADVQAIEDQVAALANIDPANPPAPAPAPAPDPNPAPAPAPTPPAGP